ncbi:hypothetical protein FACS189499_08650 [Clostridia bacterium]|nr:hypothetical protein FACS189499_08650 [Clostridia bacterium]
MNTSKNYKTDNGDKWVVGGELEVLPGATVTGLDGNGGGGGFTPAANIQPIYVGGATVDQIANTVNEILTKLKAAGLMESN